MRTLIVSKPIDGIETQIGTITFDHSNNGTLTVEKSGPLGDELRQAWETTSKINPLPMLKSERKEVDGKTVSAYRSIPVPKSDDRYPSAVWSYLEKEYAYLVDE